MRKLNCVPVDLSIFTFVAFLLISWLFCYWMHFLHGSSSILLKFNVLKGQSAQSQAKTIVNVQLHLSFSFPIHSACI